MVVRKQASRNKQILSLAQPSRENRAKRVNLAKLEKERAAHAVELERLHELLREVPETSVEEGDPAVFERENILTLIRQVEEHLTEINRALESTRRGGYGICEHCGRPIDAERLKILPETRVCVQCKTLLEKSAHHQVWY